MEEALFNQLSNSAKIGKCRTVSDFERMGKIGEGTYGIVYKAKDKKTGTVVALKRVRMESETDGIPLTSLREIKHPNIVEMLEVVVGPHVSDMFLCFEFCDHTLSELIYQIGNPFTEGEIKRLMLQLLSALAYTHERRIIHRDIKMSNLLYTNTGLLKLADFGLARLFDQPPLHYTPNVVTLWYRPPELLFGDTLYSTALDMWSAGCIFAEFLKGRPLFPGKTEAHQIELIFQILGSPSEQIWPSFINLPRVHEFIIPHKQKSQLKEKFGQLSQNGLELLQGLLTLDPDKRIKMQDALTHPYFREFPIPKSVFMMPKYPSTNNPIQQLNEKETSHFQSSQPIQEKSNTINNQFSQKTSSSSQTLQFTQNSLQQSQQQSFSQSSQSLQNLMRQLQHKDKDKKVESQSSKSQISSKIHNQLKLNQQDQKNANEIENVMKKVKRKRDEEFYEDDINSTSNRNERGVNTKETGKSSDIINLLNDYSEDKIQKEKKMDSR